jgi:SAM-dependent methyltransferase
LPESEKAEYGYDRPDFAKYLPVGTGLVVVTTALYAFHFVTGCGANLVLTLGWTFGLFFLGFGMVFLLSKGGKLKQRDILLGAIPWRGDERVLDIGCGPGLLLVGAAKRLATGKAVGIDIWNTAVETKNSPESALRNARFEGVADRVG